MVKDIYVRLLEEGVTVYRPIPASQVGENIYQLKGYDIYDPKDELWEFAPGAFVVVEEQRLTEGVFLVAIKEQEK